MNRKSIGVLGATGLVGDCILSSTILNSTSNTFDLVAFTRKPVGHIKLRSGMNISWRSLRDMSDKETLTAIESFLCMLPIWDLPKYFDLFESYGVKRIVALSSTSRFTRLESSNSVDREMALRYIDGEQQLIDWAESKGIEWVILRPTLIYRYGKDQNISVILGFIKRFGFFPLYGTGDGLRQPISADDVAEACVQVLLKNDVRNHDFNISGAETLTYKDMVKRIFEALGKKPIIISISPFIFRMSIYLLSITRIYRNISIDMAERMNTDMIFDHSEATDAFGFNPEKFHLSQSDD